jgi:dihydrofolate reductase
MRKLKLQMQMTMDGYMTGPNNELDWMVRERDDDINKYVTDLTDSVDTILMGRKMVDGFISYWTSVLKNPESPEYDFAKKMIEKPKIVFTKTLTESKWPNTNTTIATGDLTDEVNRLKRINGKDIIVYGGASFDSSLVEAGLIDEYHLFFNPSVIGNGKGIFKNLTDYQKFTLVRAIPFECGIAVLHYEPKK